LKWITQTKKFQIFWDKSGQRQDAPEQGAPSPYEQLRKEEIYNGG
jgi:hypothetical protein